MKRFKHRLEYALVTALDALFHLMPLRRAVTFGEGFGLFMSHVIPKRNRLILSNLAHAFPEKTEAERERIAKAMWRNLGRTAGEFLLMPEILSRPREFPIVWEGLEHMEKAVGEGRGVIVIAAHYSNWEILGVDIRRRFPNFKAIARPMRNPFVEAWVRSKRGSSGMDTILHREAVRASLKWVKSKNVIGILVDQNLYTGGVFVDFFGRPAATTTLPAILHARTQAPVLITYSLREGDGFRFVFESPVNPPAGVAEQNQVEAHTQEIAKRFEAIIRRKPENWFWIHNRWKRKQ